MEVFEHNTSGEEIDVDRTYTHTQTHKTCMHTNHMHTESDLWNLVWYWNLVRCWNLVLEPGIDNIKCLYGT